MKNKVVGLRPRLFLQKLYTEFQENGFTETHKSLARRFSMKTSTISKYLSLLIKADYILQSEKQGLFREKAEAKYQYKISGSGIEIVKTLDFKNSVHSDLINKIQSKEFKEKLTRDYEYILSSSDKTTFTISLDDCIYLLTQLMVHADEFGYVRNFTRSQITAVTGDSAIKIKRLTYMLKSLGLVCQITPGVSGFLGIQSSIYQVSLEHYAATQDENLINILIDIQYSLSSKIPAIDLIKQTQQIDNLSHISNNKRTLEWLEGMNELARHLNAPTMKMAHYLNQLMTIFAIKLVQKQKNLENFINLLRRDIKKLRSEERFNDFGKYKELIEALVLNDSPKINKPTKIISAMLPYFLLHTLQMSMLLRETERIGAIIYPSIYLAVSSSNKMRVNLSVSPNPDEKHLESQHLSIKAAFSKNRINKELELRLEYLPFSAFTVD